MKIVQNVFNVYFLLCYDNEVKQIIDIDKMAQCKKMSS